VIRTETRTVDNRQFLLGLDQLYREAMKTHEREELLACARVVAAALGVAPADVPVESYYHEDDALTEYFGLMRALQNETEEARAVVGSLPEFRRLDEIASAPLYGHPLYGGSLLPRGEDPLSTALLNTPVASWTIAELTASAYRTALDTDDISLVGLAALSRDAVVLTALRESAVLYAYPVAGCAMEEVRIVYSWTVDADVTERAQRFVAAFNALFTESLPAPGHETASIFWNAANDNNVMGRCVRIGFDDSKQPVRQYHWAIVIEGGELQARELWDSEIWTTERFRDRREWK